MAGSAQHQNVEVHYWHLEHEALLATAVLIISFG
jgi:hypothetical protein